MAILEALWAALIEMLPVIVNWVIVLAFALFVFALMYLIAGLFDLFDRRQRRQ